MFPKIFLSYRREDTGPWAELIYTHLEPRIGAGNLFWDVDTIPPGHDFREFIGAYLDQVDVLFVLIGRQWMKIGKTRLFQETDYVRFEIRYALERNKLVVPVLLENAGIPQSKDLPEDIRPLVFKNAFPIQPGQVKRDCELLHGRIMKWYDGQKAPRPLVPVIQSEIREAPKSNPPAAGNKTGSFTDPRDGRTYKTVELNGQTWMAENLNFDVGEGCWFYDHDPKNGEKYGRLYTWEAAKRACPAGWRLPARKEWDSLINHFGEKNKPIFRSLKGETQGLTPSWREDATAMAGSSPCAGTATSGAVRSRMRTTPGTTGSTRRTRRSTATTSVSV